MKKTFSTLSLLSIMLFYPATILAQTPADIMDRMIQKYSNSLSGIETMMVVTKMEGLIETDEPDTTYYRKVTLQDGLQTMQEVSSSRDTPSADYHSFQQNYDAIVDNSTYEGIETIDGRSAHVLLVDDISALYQGAVSGMEETAVGQEGEAMRGRLYIDANDYLLLRMSFDMQFSEEYTGTYDMNFKDYRDVNGMPYSFLAEMVIDGISEQFSAEDLAEARRGIQDARQQIENSSGMQRRILERTLSGTINRLERMLEDGGMTMRLVTLSVETNVTIPE